MRWMNRYDGTQDSLKTRSKRPKTPHPNAHTTNEIRHIENLRRRNPNIGLSELYGKLREHYAYTRHPASLFRFLRKRGVFVQKEHKKTSYRPKKQNTPKEMGKKMQLDVKYVPKECCVGKERQKIYQYTLIDECTRERFLYAFEEKNSYTTLLFLKRALLPEIIQTDNGTEFVIHREGNPTHLMQRFCDTLGIEHKPYAHTPQGTTGRSKDYTETTPSDSTANCLSTTLMISTIR